jgi:hypothetical protein
MDVKYQDIRKGRTYVLTGKNTYLYHPRLRVKVLDTPPQSFLLSDKSPDVLLTINHFFHTPKHFPVFNTRVLEVLDTPCPDPITHPFFRASYTPGQDLLINWRPNPWILPWDDYGYCWTFTNILLEPLERNKDDQKRMLNELKALPSLPAQNPVFPGGVDYVQLLHCKSISLSLS